MAVPRYLPAIRTRVRRHVLGRLSVRTSEDRELGALIGFVIDSGSRHLSSLVLEVVTASGSQQVELSMVPLCFDAESAALRMIEPGVPSMVAFRPESASPIDEDDLWIPFFHTAA